MSVVGLHNRETPCSLLPGSQKDEGVQTHFGPLPFEQVHCQQDMLTIRQLLKLVKQGIWFTTIDLKDTYFYVNVALKHRKFLGFALQRVQQAFLSFRQPHVPLLPRWFWECDLQGVDWVFTPKGFLPWLPRSEFSGPD